MKMADMKMPKKTKKEMMGESIPAEIEKDRWPYGLQLRFENEELSKLPHLKELKVGTKVMVQGMGVVTAIRSNERQGGKEDNSVEIQLHEVGCESKKKEEPQSMSDMMSGVKAGRHL